MVFRQVTRPIASIYCQPKETGNMNTISQLFDNGALKHKLFSIAYYFDSFYYPGPVGHFEKVFAQSHFDYQKLKTEIEAASFGSETVDTIQEKAAHLLGLLDDIEKRGTTESLNIFMAFVSGSLFTNLIDQSCQVQRYIVLGIATAVLVIVFIYFGAKKSSIGNLKQALKNLSASTKTSTL